VADAAQHLGLGTEFLRRLIEIARDEKFMSIVAHILHDNSGMRGLANRFGFVVKPSADPAQITAVLSL
jgi:acetyltransferase